VSAATPGQAAYEVWRAAVPEIVCNVPAGKWEDLPETIRAGFDAIVAREPHAAPDPQGRPTTSPEDAMLANIDGLNGLVRDILQSLPDTADEQQWRDRAGALNVCDPDGMPYAAYTEADL
jgi:hypothetical protein